MIEMKTPVTIELPKELKGRTVECHYFKGVVENTIASGWIDSRTGVIIIRVSDTLSPFRQLVAVSYLLHMIEAEPKDYHYWYVDQPLPLVDLSSK